MSETSVPVIHAAQYTPNIHFMRMMSDDFITLEGEFFFNQLELDPQLRWTAKEAGTVRYLVDCFDVSKLKIWGIPPMPVARGETLAITLTGGKQWQT